jgi:tricorn protease-like protein
MSQWTVPQQTPNASAYFAAVPHGEHVALIGHVAPNCTASPATLPISVPAQSEATFAITCDASDGVRITTNTTGVDPDSDDYLLDLVRTGGGETLALPSNGTTSRYGLLFGDFTLTLRAIAANCRVIGANPRTVAVPDGGVTDVTFDVSCETPGVLAYARPTDFAGGLTIGPSDIHVVNARAAQVGPLTTVPAHDADPAWSPEGARIAFTSNRDGNEEIYAMNGDGSSPARLTTNAARDYYAAWSPDGSRIAFVSERDGNAEIYVMNADGTTPIRLTTHAAADDSPAWSPDGARIAFRSDRDGNQEIYVMNADGSAIQRLTVDGADDRDPAWSPDGTKIAFSRLDGCGDVDGAGTLLCGSALLIMLADGSNVTSVVSGIPHDPNQIIQGAGDVRQPAWSPDGRKIAAAVSYCGGDGDCHVMMGIWIIDLAVPDPVEVFGFESYATSGVAYPFRPSWRNIGAP